MEQLTNILLLGSLAGGAKPFLDKNKDVQCKVIVKNCNLFFCGKVSAAHKKYCIVEVNQTILNEVLFHFAEEGCYVLIAANPVPGTNRLCAHRIVPIKR